MATLNGTGGGHLKFFGTGHATTQQARSIPPNFDFGAMPLLVAGSLSIQAYDTDANGRAGVLDGGVFISTSGGLQKRTSAGANVPVSGLDVAEGGTLTLTPNAATPGQMSLNLPTDVRVNGILQGSQGAVSIGGRNIATGSSAQVLSGDGSPITFTAAAGAWLAGTVDLRSASGNVGKNGGVLVVTASAPIVLSASVTNQGGSASMGAGGFGGVVVLTASEGDVFVDGAIDVSGGSGPAGSGSAVVIEGIANGGLFVGAPSLSAHGGACTSSAKAGSAGTFIASSGWKDIEIIGTVINFAGGAGNSTCDGGSSGTIASAHRRTARFERRGDPGLWGRGCGRAVDAQRDGFD